jgi:hypothetical protein
MVITQRLNNQGRNQKINRSQPKARSFTDRDSHLAFLRFKSPPRLSTPLVMDNQMRTGGKNMGKRGLAEDNEY